MTTFIQLVFSGLALGCDYALIALGFTIIFKASEVINFAQGEFLLVGTFVVSTAMFTWRLGFFPALLIGMALTALIGVIFERVVLRRMIGRPPFTIIMVTIGLDVLLLTAVTILVGGKNLASPVPFDPLSAVTIGGVTFTANAIASIVVTALICAALYAFLRFTRYGLAMRATAIDQEAARAMGIKISTVYALAWGISGAIATIGGIFLSAGAGNPAFDVTLGQAALVAFPAIILGGLDSIPGAVVGGIIIGLVYMLTQGYESSSFLGNNFHLIAPYLVMILVLLIRPYGLFGTRKVERI
ncbi:MAG TPA: branched-chain amino acid ABC transporter permease [Ktedonobacterales bacterium]|jgi:branched-chain amino acid transport system permease protein|nr:branched-chain amino acid ABC transporter permease [Ktedonobacterales bacterium]